MAGELGTDLVNGLMNPPPDPTDPAYIEWLKKQQAQQAPPMGENWSPEARRDELADRAGAGAGRGADHW